MATTTEKYTTLAETTVAATYTAGSGTLVVASGALFPATPNFHVRLFNDARTVLKVTAVAGTTWTVVAEVNDGNAAIGAFVVLVQSAASLDAVRADIQQLTTFAAANATEKAGIIQQYSDSPVRARDNGAGFDYSVHGWPVKLLDQSAWTSFGTPTVDQSLGSVTLTGPVSGGTQLRGRLRGSYPATPFTLVVGLRPLFAVSPGAVSMLAVVGLVLSDGTKFKNFVCANFDFNTAAPPPAIWVGTYNNATSAVSAPARATNILMQDIMWLKLVDNGTNLTYSYSLNKKTYVQLLTELRTTFLTPSDIGIVMTNQGSTPPFDQGGDIISWELN